MAQTENKMLVLGALAGVAGVSLAVVCYQGFKSRQTGSWMMLDPRSTKGQAAGTMFVDGPGVAGSQADVLERLEALIHCVSDLKDEIKALKNALPTLQAQVTEKLRGDSAAGGPLHRTIPTRRKRAAGTATGVRTGSRSSEEAESEGGYITALTDSEEEDLSDAEQTDEEEHVDKLSALLQQVDSLHRGSESDKRESLRILLEHTEEFGQTSTFLWRLIRAYSDIHDISSTMEEKKTHAESGKKIGEDAVKLNPTCAESHQWYAIICGIMADYDTMQNKIKNGYIFKDHLDKAIELKPHDPFSYYLLGRWCYAVAQLSWIERKVAATLFGEPPSATIEDALKNFLKVEEIQPGYSKTNYVFLAKCYKDLGQQGNARKMCEAASSMSTTSKEDEEAQKELDLLWPLLDI
ncbi:regulator of microtubule dynamics protein 2 isoform X1 [Thalassophryne amazonica]|uniref:regulator of microtubule dynamics protein 2 isoform X1 n=1 Tax=Thalassophryne amazonica TaxID=390379 RepID=UPI001471CE78|nr:regulator of microtubule dynamics protein 2 isoform X1 [Thalassophryne amazonica]